MTLGVPAAPDNEDEHAARVQGWSEALEHMCQALELLDATNAPADLGARLDQAINELREVLEHSGLKEA